MDAVRMAICTSAEPVSLDERPYLAAISAFCSLERGTKRTPCSRMGSLRMQSSLGPLRRPVHHTKGPAWCATYSRRMQPTLQVLALVTNIPGPLAAAALLADGAQVVKVEP